MHCLGSKQGAEKIHCWNFYITRCFDLIKRTIRKFKMSNSLISASDRKSRAYWVKEIEKISGDFGSDSDKVEKELTDEISKGGINTLVAHLRLCGDIPEQYSHDSTEEKLYSKYTDALLSCTFNFIGMKSNVLKERADAADVETEAEGYSFVSDAKAFRLSRTAKNQKDFKIQAMDGWKRGKPYAMVVCPIYQLPARSSQIYEQASSRNVCIFTYSHLAVLARFSESNTKQKTNSLLLKIFEAVKNRQVSKDADSYWRAVNGAMLSFDPSIKTLWADEKKAAIESIDVAKDISLSFIKGSKDKITAMTREQAINELLQAHKFDSRINIIENVSDNQIMDIS